MVGCLYMNNYKLSTDKAVADALSFDALREAEIITNKSYKESNETTRLGFAMHIEHNKQKEALLKFTKDTYYGSTLEEYLTVVKDLGFEKILETPIPEDKKFNSNGDYYYIYWRADGIILSFDTYRGNKVVNSGNFYYNLKPKNDPFTKDSTDYWNLKYSGQWKEINGAYYLIASNDCREGLRHYISRLESLGGFVNPWIASPFIWFLHYMDTKDKKYDYNKINSERIALLPEYVQKCIKGLV